MCRPSLANQVERLEARAADLETLCGDILATLEANKEVLGPADPALRAEWETIVKRWNARLKEPS